MLSLSPSHPDQPGGHKSSLVWVWVELLHFCMHCPPASLPMLPATCKTFTASTDLSCHILSHDITVLTRLSYDALTYFVH